MKKILWPVKALLLDMDGVITNTMPDHFRAWRRVLEPEGIRVTQQDIYRREGQRGLPSIFEIFQDYGKQCPALKAKRLLAQKEALLKKNVRVRYIPGARRFIRSMHRQGVRLALVTGTSRHESMKILPPGLTGCFDALVTGSDITNGKPAPDPFQIALRALHLDARRTVVIENAPCGIQSAKTAGCPCVALATSLPASFLRDADFTYRSFNDMLKHIAFTRA